MTLRKQSHVLSAYAFLFSYLLKKFEFIAYLNQIEVLIETEDVDPTAWAAGVEDDGVPLRSEVGREFTIQRLHVISRGSGGHDEEDERNEQQRHRDD